MAKDNSWAYELENTVFSIVKAKTYTQLKKIYPGILFTDVGESDSVAVFPTVYIHMLSPAERGQTLDGQSINGLSVTFQVEVSTNTNKSDAQKVMSMVAEVFKQMRFEGNLLPEYTYANRIYKSTARFKRIVGSDDRLI